MTVWRREHRVLHDEIAKHLTTGVPQEVNLSLPRHGVATPVLHRFVYDPARAGQVVRIVFLDGSRVRPGFAVGCLTLSEPGLIAQKEPHLRVGLMSFRHPELDYLVDLYVTRNRELAEKPSMADEEQLAFARTVALLRDATFKDGGDIWAYHTGLEPMVIGFYRGVVQVLRERTEQKLPRTLVIRPFVYHGHKDKGPFDRQSPGAQHQSYKAFDPWW